MTGIIRYATVNDIGQIVPLQQKCFFQLGLEKYFRFDPIQTIKYLSEHITNPNYVGLVGEIDGKIVGCIGMSITTFGSDASTKIASEVGWWVEEEHRKDLGKPILVAAIKVAKQKGAEVIKLSAPAGSKLELLYKRMGFLPAETNYLKRI